MKEDTVWIAFPSVTYANKARYYLGRGGIGSHMERIPESENAKNCGYRLEISASEKERALEICIRNGIRMTEEQAE